MLAQNRSVIILVQIVLEVRRLLAVKLLERLELGAFLNPPDCGPRLVYGCIILPFCMEQIGGVVVLDPHGLWVHLIATEQPEIDRNYGHRSA